MTPRRTVAGSGRPRRGAAVLVVAALLALAPAPLRASAAPAVTGSPCSDPTGITVVVDFRDLGGGVEVRCAPQPVASGWDALERAGFEPTRVQRFPGALCRIDGQPANDPCQNMPPASAFWGYWNAARGGSWCYATKGPDRKPPSGSVEGWAYSKGKTEASATQPGYAPPAPIPGTTPSTVSSTCGSAPTTQPPPVTAPPAPVPDPPSGGDGGDSGDGPGATPTTRRPRPGDGGTATTATADAGAPAIDGEPLASTSSSSSTSSPADDEQAGGEVRITERDEGGGSPLGAIVGGTAVALLGGAAAATAWRRRRLEGP